MNWIEIKALNTIYTLGEIKLNQTLKNSSEIDYLINSRSALEKDSYKVKSCEKFNNIYINEYIEKYKLYHYFLNSYDLEKPYYRFEENDIKKLIEIHTLKQDGSLNELLEQIIKYDESIRGISQMFFKHEKYLDDKGSVVTALKRILNIANFAEEKDQQYIYKLECHSPKVIVLCENLDFLKKPAKPRQHGIELWYAGGKNVSKLDYVDTRGLPIYYSCDWDYDGLFIIYPLVKSKINSIQLLTPTGHSKSIVETEHDSKWENISNKLNQLLTVDQLAKLQELIKSDSWIIEESNDLLQMINIQAS